MIKSLQDFNLPDHLGAQRIVRRGFLKYKLNSDLSLCNQMLGHCLCLTFYFGEGA